MSKSLKPFKISFAVFAILLLSFSTLSCRQAGKTKESTDTLKLAYRNANIDYDVIVQTAIKKGYFKENDLNIDLKKVEKNTDKFIISGEVDLGIQAISSMMTAYLNDKPTKSVGILYNYDPISVMISRYPLSQINKVKTVGATIGNPTHIYLEVALEELGINDKVKYVSTGPVDSARIAMMQKNEIDLTTVTYADSVKKIESRDDFYFYKRSDIDVFQHKAIITTDKILKEKREPIKRFLKAMSQSIEYIKTHKKETVGFLGSEYDMPANDAITMYEGMMGSLNYSYQIDIDKLDTTVKAIKKINKPSNPNRDIKGFFDTTLIEIN